MSNVGNILKQRCYLCPKLSLLNTQTKHRISIRYWLTMTGKTLGTVAYMSPEQAQNLTVDHRTDNWSLGVVLFEMLTGRLPFKGEFIQAMMYSIVNEEPEPITGLCQDLPIELEWIIFKCLEKEKKNRYLRVEGLSNDLNKLKQNINRSCKGTDFRDLWLREFFLQ